VGLGETTKMPAKGTTKLTEQKFNTVTVQLASNPYTPDMVKVIAKANGIAPSTVVTIHKQGTWAKFQNRKNTKTTVIRPKKGKISVEDDFERQFADILKKDLHEVRGDLRALLKRVQNLEEAAIQAKQLKRWWNR
jgi:hypothetical protein